MGWLNIYTIQGCHQSLCRFYNIVRHIYKYIFSSLSPELPLHMILKHCFNSLQSVNDCTIKKCGYHAVFKAPAEQTRRKRIMPEQFVHSIYIHLVLIKINEINHVNWCFWFGYIVGVCSSLTIWPATTKLSKQFVNLCLNIYRIPF